MSNVFLGLDKVGDLFTDGSVVSVGNFDGVHIGHQKVIETTVAAAKRDGLKSILVTFSPHTSLYYNKQFKCLSLLGSKCSIIEEIFGSSSPDVIIVLDFKQYAEMTASLFISNVLLGALNCKQFVCGKNFRFGKGRGGSIKDILEAGIDVIDTPPAFYRGIPVSSTLIRKCLIHGAVGLAGKLLGRKYSISSMISRGERRRMVVPTLNMYIHESQMLLPKFGIYPSEIYLEGVNYKAISSFGVAPTMRDDGAVCLEVHALEEIPDIEYDGVDATVTFIQFLRPERKFKNISILQWHIEDDVDKAKFLANSKVSDII